MPNSSIKNQLLTNMATGDLCFFILDNQQKVKTSLTFFKEALGTLILIDDQHGQVITEPLDYSCNIHFTVKCGV